MPNNRRRSTTQSEAYNPIENEQKNPRRRRGNFWEKNPRFLRGKIRAEGAENFGEKIHVFENQ